MRRDRRAATRGGFHIWRKAARRSSFPSAMQQQPRQHMGQPSHYYITILGEAAFRRRFRHAGRRYSSKQEERQLDD